MSSHKKVVIITGAGGGIGQAISIQFAEAGARLVLVDVDHERIKATVDCCAKAGAAKSDMLPLKIDLQKETEIKELIAKTIENFGRIDVLINNAAISSKQQITDTNFMDNYQVTFDVNLKAPLILMNMAVPYLIKTKGNIINITSVGGIHPLRDLPIYNASKAAFRNITQCIALQIASQGVRVNAIAPAGVKTEMVRLVGVQDVEAFNRERAKQLPLQKMIEPKEVAQLAEYLASDKASSITGAEFVIDAGHLLGGGAPTYK